MSVYFQEDIYEKQKIQRVMLKYYKEKWWGRRMKDRYSGEVRRGKEMVEGKT